MQYINGTKAVVYIGKVVKTQGTYDPDGHEITPPIYYDGVAYDIMSTDDLDFGVMKFIQLIMQHINFTDTQETQKCLNLNRWICKT